MQHQLPQLYCMWSYWKLRLVQVPKKYPKSPTKGGASKVMPETFWFWCTKPFVAVVYARFFFFHRQGTRKALPKYQQNQSNCDILVNYRSILLEIGRSEGENWTNNGPVKSSSRPETKLDRLTVWVKPQLTANWHTNFGSQLIHPFQKIHMFRDPPKKTTFRIHLEMMCLQKRTILV